MAARRSRFSVSAQILGILGLVLSLILAIGAVLGHGWMSGLVDDVFASVGGTVDRGATIAEDATDRLAERAAEIDAFLGEMLGAAGDIEVPNAVAERASAVADRVDELRAAYASLRARLDAAFDTIAVVARFAPGLDLPTEPPDILTDLDARLVEIDAAVRDVRAGVAGSMTRLIDGVTSLRTATERVQALSDRVETAIAEVDARIDRAHDTLDGYLQLVLIVLLALVGYIAVLNLVIVLLARRRPESAE